VQYFEVKMTIFDDARSGILIGARLENWLRPNPEVLNSQDDSTGWTLLATAVVSGFPNQVEQLLKKGAMATLRCKMGETPLLLAAWKTSMERPLIVQKLLSYVPKASIDDTCDIAENNTPLMCAIEKLDVDSVRLLARAGARLHVKNDDGFNAVDVAINTGKYSVRNALEPEKEQSKLARLASNVISVVRHVVSWLDNKFKGFMSKVFNFKGERHKSAEKVPDYPWTFKLA
jgi:ankyrin repeat protein